MTYLQTILETEGRAKDVVEQAEREAAQTIAHARTVITEKEARTRAALEEERAAVLTAQAEVLATERTKALAAAQADVDKLVAQVRPKQSQAIAYITGLMVE